ncbi:unnamed protein product [Closterium sp. NIES-64]|nr:unnamed protein product [Closterium sp. NIES-64]
MQPGTDEEATGGGGAGGGGGEGGLGGSGNAGAAATAAAFFPRGMRVLVVDDDPLCLMILERMLRRCNYQGPSTHVATYSLTEGPSSSPSPSLAPLSRCTHAHLTTCNKATTALALLREGREAYDLVISDVYMPDMDGFKLLERIGLEMDLPVIIRHEPPLVPLLLLYLHISSPFLPNLPSSPLPNRPSVSVPPLSHRPQPLPLHPSPIPHPAPTPPVMSANGETSVVMKGITHGAVDYLLKPVRIEELRNIWQHVGEEHSGSVEEEELRRMRDGTHDPASSSGGGGGLGEWESTHPDAETGAGGGAGGGGGGAGQGPSVSRSPSRNEGARLGKRSVEAAFGEERGEYGGGRGERGGLGGGEGMKGGEENAAGEADFRAAANASAAAAAAAGLGLGAGGDGGGGGMLSAGMGYMGRLPYVMEEGESDMVGGLKKARIIWSVELHQQFVKAVHHLGVDRKYSSGELGTSGWQDAAGVWFVCFSLERRGEGFGEEGGRELGKKGGGSWGRRGEGVGEEGGK